ncbi:MAG: hypothetical protein ACP5KW_11140 [Thermoproteota archaeon]
MQLKEKRLLNVRGIADPIILATTRKEGTKSITGDKHLADFLS